MNAWSATTASGVFGVLIEGPAMREIDRMCAVAGNVETGGVLIGRYSADLTTAIVVEATPAPPDSRHGPTWFSRGSLGLCRMLRRRWRANMQTYYVGEWHFHPAARVEPSKEDVIQMYRICQDPNYCCVEPILLILGTSTGDQVRPARAFVFPRGEWYLELVQHPHDSSNMR